MVGSSESNSNTPEELLADWLTGGRAAGDSPATEWDDSSLELTAASIDLAESDQKFEPLPAQLRERVMADAAAWMATQKGFRVVREPADRSTPVLPADDARRSRRSMKFWQGRGAAWLVAAACLVLAVIAWTVRLPEAGSPSEKRSRMLAGSGVLQLAWAENNLGVTGDVIWDGGAQEGYLRMNGLPVNDPNLVQYQLWVFDGKREVYDAVDGGVFDVATEGEAVIPIDAKLKVFEPTLFAVTTEPPGGVVKHDPELDPERYRIILTAAVPRL